MINESDRVVLIAGAGFSAANGLPLMRDFADFAHRSYFNHKRYKDSDQATVASYEKMFAFQAECERSSGAFLRDWENIEELYTQADLRRLAGIPTREAAEQLCGSIAWAIWDVYRRGITPAGQPAPMDLLPRIIEKFESSNKLVTTIVTTNYDLVIENALLRLRPFHYPGFLRLDNSYSGTLYCVREADAVPEYPSGSVELIKLHGSVNWFKGGDEHYCSAIFDRQEGRKGVANPEFTQQYAASAIVTSNTNLNPGLVQPAIIPPMLGKAALSRVVTKQWNAAIRAIRKARHIIIIGYSFPATDTFMTRLLTEAVHQNDDLHSLLIVDPSDEAAWRRKNDEMFAPTFLRKKVRHIRETGIRCMDLLNIGGIGALLNWRE
jgi:NAD-dependent SIR2 family protein deacetylase